MIDYMKPKSKYNIYLRIPIPEDIDFMLRMENDPEIWSVSQTTEPFTRFEIESFITGNDHDLFRELQQRFVVVLKDADIPIGSVDLFNYDADTNSAGVGISILKEYREKSYGTQALELLIDKAFKDLGLKYLHCSIYDDNRASTRLFESLGFQRDKKSEPKYSSVKSDVRERFYRLEKNKYF
jgi:diamine N-acetyltransferase